MKYGYARVSTDGQNVDAQVRQLTKAGCKRCSAKWRAAQRPTGRVARGQRMGRPPKPTPHQQREATKRRDQGDESLAEIGRSYNVSAATISRLTAHE